jgi:hypothetical protein
METWRKRRRLQDRPPRSAASLGWPLGIGLPRPEAEGFLTVGGVHALNPFMALAPITSTIASIYPILSLWAMLFIRTALRRPGTRLQLLFGCGAGRSRRKGGGEDRRRKGVSERPVLTFRRLGWHLPAALKDLAGGPLPFVEWRFETDPQRPAQSPVPTRECGVRLARPARSSPRLIAVSAAPINRS